MKKEKGFSLIEIIIAILIVTTGLLALSLTEASVKSRSGGANDDEEDLDLPYWTGVIPLHVVAGEPENNPDSETATCFTPGSWDNRSCNSPAARSEAAPTGSRAG